MAAAILLNSVMVAKAGMSYFNQTFVARSVISGTPPPRVVYSVTVSGWLFVFTANCFFTIALVTAFMLLRNRLPDYFQPFRAPKSQKLKRFDDLFGDEEEEIIEDTRPKGEKTPLIRKASSLSAIQVSSTRRIKGGKKVRVSFGEFVKNLFSFQELHDPRDPDASLYLTFLKLGMILFVGSAVFGASVLLPIHWDGGGGQTGMAKLLISNVPRGSPMLWAHLLATFMYSFAVYYFLWFSYNKFYDMRKARMSRTDLVENYSVMVSEIVLGKGETIEKYLDRIFPGEVLSVQRPMFIPYITLLERKAELKKELKVFQQELEETEKRATIYSTIDNDILISRPSARQGVFASLKSIDEFNEALEFINKQIMYKQRKEPAALTNVCFVTFKTMMTANICSQALVGGPAQWEKSHLLIVFLRSCFAASFMFVLTFFWGIPVAFILSYASVQNLAQWKPLSWLNHLVIQNQDVSGIIQNLLPSVILSIFMASVPFIVWATERIKRFRRETGFEKSVLISYHLFLIFNILLITTIAGSIFEVMVELAENPSRIVTLLSNSLPEQSIFFLNYTIVYGVTTHGIELIRPFGLIAHLKNRYRTKKDHVITEDEWWDRYREEIGNNPYSIKFPQILLIFTVTSVYSIISPFILILGTLYFFAGYVVERYNCKYVYRNAFSSQATYWPIIANGVFLAVFLFQILMFGVFSFMKFPGGSICGLLPIITTIYWRWLNTRFVKSCNNLSLNDCAHKDTAREEWRDAYEQPFIKEANFAFQLHYFANESRATLY